LGQPPKLEIGAPMTIMAWAQPAAGKDYHAGYFSIVNHGPHPSGGEFADLFFGIFNGSYTIMSCFRDRVPMACFPVPPDDAGTWVHLAAVCDGAAWVLYRNGLQVAGLPQVTST